MREYSFNQKIHYKYPYPYDARHSTGHDGYMPLNAGPSSILLFFFFFFALNSMAPLQDAIRFLSGDRLLAFSKDHMLIYSFVTAGEAGVAPPVVAPHVTEPLWKLPFTGTRIDFGAMSQGLLNETAKLFVVNARPLYRSMASLLYTTSTEYLIFTY